MARIEQSGAVSQIIFESIGGDLVVQGHSGLGFQIDGDNPNIQQRDTGVVHIVCGGDCSAAVPDGVAIRVLTVGGDAKFTQLTGDVVLDNIGGGLVLRHITGNLTLGNVGGDLSVRHVTGNLNLNNVGSDLVIKHCNGDIFVANVGSDAVLKNLTGNLAIANVGSDLLVEAVNGDLKVEEVGSNLSVADLNGSCYCGLARSDILLALNFDPEKTYMFGSESDIVCTVIPGTRARFILPADIEVSFDDLEDAVYQRDSHNQILIVGDGGAEVQITEASSFSLVPYEHGKKRGFNIEFEMDFDRNIDAMVNNLESTINQSLRGLGEKIEQQTQQAVNAATNFTTSFVGNNKDWGAKAESMARRAREQAERARERAERFQERQERRQSHFEERMQERTDRRQERFQQRFEDRGGQKSTKRTSEWEPVSQEERLVILEMLQNGSISVDQAEQLLKTLDGDNS